MAQQKYYPILTISIFLAFCLLVVNSLYAADLNKVRWQPQPGTVALTFDDGPSPIYTPQVLKILKEKNVKATFFVMGWAARAYPNLIKQMVADGHAVAIHTNSHPNLTKISDKQLNYEISMPKAEVTKIIGKPPVCLRPPFGAKNKHVQAVTESYDLVLVPMGFNSFDYEKPGVEKLTNWVVQNAHSGQVFLLHDGFKGKEQTVKALPGIIDGIRKRGLGFSAICYP